MVFIIWDRIFGTFREENLKEPIKYGLTHNLEDTGTINTIFHEFKALRADVKKAPGFRNKLLYIFNPPGWSHDGSTHTARVLQREFNEVKKAS